MSDLPINQDSVGQDPDGEKLSVLAAMERWVEAIMTTDPRTVAELYAEDAVLWGTVSPLLRTTREAIQDYFEHFMKLEKLNVAYSNPQVRVLGDVAVNSGNYTFFHEADGAVRSIPARYSFVYRRAPSGEWKIIDHHSSRVPREP